MDEKRFFVTGGAGGIGSGLVGRLIRGGASVVVYDNLVSGVYEFIKDFERTGSLTFIKADILDADRLSDAVKDSDADVIIHLAANPNILLGTKETDLDLRQGTIGTYNVLEAARKNDVKDILFSSSSIVYGVPTIRPTPETYGPMKPISLYGASKLASEGLITAFSHLFDMRYYIYRLANVVGKNLTHGVIVDLINKLKRNNKELEVLGNGEQKKSYIDVGDCVDAILYVYERSKEKENIFNVTTNDQISVKEIAELIVDRVAKGAVIKYTGTAQGWRGDVTDTFLSNKKLTELGWKPRYNSHEAVKNAVELLLKGH